MAGRSTFEQVLNLDSTMKRFKQTLTTAAMTLALLAGGYTAAQAQDDVREPEGENGDMQQMMQDCPMMNENESAERSPMMDGMMANMMESCPMMQQMMQRMMEDCPMMQQMMEDGTMMEGMEGMGNNGGMHGMQMDESASSMSATVENGVQTADVTVGPRGFQPSNLTLKAGVPARLTFTRTVENTCATQVQIPDFDIGKTDLPLNEPVTIEFTPAEAGSYTFSCGMNMMKGTLNVTRTDK